MLKLAFDREPFWLDVLPGVRVQFRPISVAAILLARTAAADVLRAGGDDAAVKAGVAFTRSLAHTGIAAWEGIGDKDGNPVDPSKETVDTALELWPVFDAIDRLYVGPALIQDAEKNASSPLPSGTSAGVKDTAPRAAKRVLRAPIANMRRQRPTELPPGAC